MAFQIPFASLNTYESNSIPQIIRNYDVNHYFSFPLLKCPMAVCPSSVSVLELVNIFFSTVKAPGEVLSI